MLVLVVSAGAGAGACVRAENSVRIDKRYVFSSFL